MADHRCVSYRLSFIGAVTVPQWQVQAAPVDRRRLAVTYAGVLPVLEESRLPAAVIVPQRPVVRQVDQPTIETLA